VVFWRGCGLWRRPTVKKVAIVGGILIVVLFILWLALSGGGGDGTTDNKTPPEVKWEGTMATSTDNVLVTYNGRVVRCMANETMYPRHFVVVVTNYADMSLTCDVNVREAAPEGCYPGEVSWLKIAPTPAILAQKSGSIPIMVKLPTTVRDGKYALEVVISKGDQSLTFPVIFDVKKDEKPRPL
jgi:hypothetical protein